MNQFSVGKATVARIEETYQRGLRPEGAVSGIHRRDPRRARALARARPLRSGVGQDQAQRAQLAAADRRAEDPDRRLLRQQPHARDAAVVEHAEHALSRPARRGGRAAGRDRSGDVHAPASRSRRLEHAAEGRPLGADVSRTRATCSPSPTSTTSTRPTSTRRPRRSSSARSANACCRSSRPGAPTWSTGTAPAQRSHRDRAGARPFARPRRVPAGERRRSTAPFIGDVFHHLLQVYYPHWNFPKNSDAEQAKRQPPRGAGALRRRKARWCFPAMSARRSPATSRRARRAFCRALRGSVPAPSG